MNRVRLGLSAPRELAALKAGLEASAELLGLLEEDQGEDQAAGALAWLTQGMRPQDETVSLIDGALAPDPAGEPGEGNVIREGFSPELDELRLASRDAREFIATLERKEKERTGVKTLKVGYNRVFGYYIEVSNSNLSQVPADYIRRQTLVGGERFITPELKEYESVILNARERIEELERSLYRQVCAQIGERAQAILALAEGVAHIDAFAALAEAASRYGYVRPTLTDGDSVDIAEGPASRGREGHAPRHLRAQRRQPVRRRCPADRPHRSQHGRQEHLHPPGGPDRPSWPRSEASCPPGRPRWGWWTEYSPGWASRTTWPPGAPPSWWRWWRPRPSSTRPPPAPW